MSDQFFQFERTGPDPRADGSGAADSPGAVVSSNGNGQGECTDPDRGPETAAASGGGAGAPADGDGPADARVTSEGPVSGDNAANATKHGAPEAQWQASRAGQGGDRVRPTAVPAPIPEPPATYDSKDPVVRHFGMLFPGCEASHGDAGDASAGAATPNLPARMADFQTPKRRRRIWRTLIRWIWPAD